jgi:hypothetical protein
MLFLKIFSMMIWTAYINPELIAIRKLYELADQSKSNYKLFNTTLTRAVSIDMAVKKGYTAAGLMISASYENNPLIKLKYFNNGKAILEEVISEHQKNIELHYIRFTIQEHCPRILGYRGQLNQDKLLLLQQISKTTIAIDKDLEERIILYLLKSEKLQIKQR